VKALDTFSFELPDDAAARTRAQEIADRKRLWLRMLLDTSYSGSNQCVATRL